MNLYEVSWQFEQGDAEWCDSFLYEAESIDALGKILRSIKNNNGDDPDMSVIFAQIMDDDMDDADDRDITDELLEDILAD